MTDRPRLLFLAYCFPPLNAIACVRAWNMAKYLARLGWEVTVVTPDPSLWRSVERVSEWDAQVEHEGVRRILTGHHWRCLAKDYVRCQDHGLAYLAGGLCRRLTRCLDISPVAGWTSAVYQACERLRPGDVDVILATGSPYDAFKIARQLGRRLGCPYVLDYRDGWTAGDPLRHRRRRGSCVATVCAEERVLSDCSATITVSPALAEAIVQTFGGREKTHVVTNGYDPEEIGRVSPKDFGHFALVYAGTLYPPCSDLTSVAAALDQLARNGGDLPNWRLHYYGPQGAEVRQEMEKHALQDRLVLHGRVPRREALEAVKGAGVSIVIASVAEVGTLSDRAVVTAKLFDAIGLRTPVLLVAPPGNNAGVILETTGLGRRFTASDTQGMAAFLGELMRGVAPPARTPESHSWPELGKSLDSILRPLLTPAKGRQR